MNMFKYKLPFKLRLLLIALSLSNVFPLPNAKAQQTQETKPAPALDYQPVKLGSDAQKNAELATVIVHDGTLSRIIPALASVMADDARTLHLKPAGSGKVMSINLILGARVAKGDILLEYRDNALRVANVQVTQAQAALEAAIAAQDEAEAAYQRARQLAGGAISRGEVSRRYALLQEAKSTVAMRQADITNTSNRIKEFNTATEQGDHLQTSSLIAPVDGLVLAVNTSMDGDLTAGQDVATIVDLSSVWVVSEVPPMDAAFITMGAHQYSFLAGRPETRIDSVVETIDGVVNPATGLIRIRSHIPNKHYALRPGMMLEARITSTTKISGVIVPSEAVQQINGNDVVFIPIDADSFQPRAVKIGLESDGQTIILSGLKDGESVVTRGSFTLKSVMLLADTAGGD
ncbi:efflux RND transporter periplasmic adaptor subunit [Beijerinckia indica]|uniref:Efflux transporter, RND family, MFP subunit n=1 Tax=Beijerinckia indica subsp. indica (strain ATCC 9039 / DSM 1715 / NCIMB 8712) TaxID=395963 RepID=B2IG15_BEII9|nr:efflux RND transporter periplasmic adaptor subunit [Beijerinckia indica]ACB95772.1 efflux transporter, RND family, MFP subunit [Beijerinckia indica subsp. indica ATCC 9039]